MEETNHAVLKASLLKDHESQYNKTVSGRVFKRDTVTIPWFFADSSILRGPVNKNDMHSTLFLPVSDGAVARDDRCDAMRIERI